MYVAQLLISREVKILLAQCNKSFQQIQLQFNEALMNYIIHGVRSIVLLPI